MKHSKTGVAQDGAPPRSSGRSTRGRVLTAAFAVFCKRGFSGASMLEIATRARVSKRDLYALFDNKHAVLADCISERARWMRRPLDAAAPVPPSGEALAATLVELGASILRGVSPWSAGGLSAHDCRIRSRTRDRPYSRQQWPGATPPGSSALGCGELE
jgi:AcrR family transcriptional regulator